MSVYSYKLWVLGAFRLEDADGAEVRLKGRKAQALLTYLAVEQRAVSRERLAALLWGDMGDERARANLRQTISEIRRTLSADVLLDDDGIRAEGIWVDAVHAPESYDGELLENLDLDEESFDAWLQTARRRCRDAALDALGDSVEDLEKKLAIDPTHEPSHRRLMERLPRAEAIRQYRRCEAALASLDLAPSSETIALFERIRGSMERARVEKPSVAVLRFANLAHSDEQYFSDGITEEILIALSKFDSLLVSARAASFAFGRDADPRLVAERLNVHYLVEGSVRRSNDRVRISVQLVDARRGETLWAERFDREMGCIFEIQDEVATTIVARVAGRVESVRLRSTRHSPTNSLAAYDCLLRGKDHHHRYTIEDNLLAREWLARALELDPGYAVAHAWMACTLAQAHALSPEPGLFDTAFQHVTKARELDDSESECHRILAAYYLMQKRFEEARVHQDRALALNPNDDRIVCQMGEFLALLEDPEDALPWIERAMRLNPSHPDSHWYDLGRAHFEAEHFDEAARALRRIASPRAKHLAYLAASLAASGEDATDATAALRQLAPAFDRKGFVEAQPYADPRRAERLASALRAAGL